MDAFLRELAESIRRDRLLPRGCRMLVAVSGGCDSMALLQALNRLASKFAWRIEVAHYNHRLRGRASDADERLVRRTCARLGVPVHVGHWARTERDLAIKQGGVEDAARQARRTFLGEVTSRIGIQRVVTAHHADDQVELFFVRLFRGATSSGLGGMHPRLKHGPPLNAWLVRPFLARWRSDIAQWARANKVIFREDASNHERRFLRNRIRQQLLPRLRAEFGEALPKVIVRTMRGLADDAEFLRHEAGRILREPDQRLGAFEEQPSSLQRQILAVQLENRRIRLDRDLVERLRLNPNKWLSIADDQLVSRDDRGRLLVRRERVLDFDLRSRRIDLDSPAGEAMLGAARVHWSLTRPRRPLSFGRDREYFDAAAVGEKVTVRYWQPGDRMQPIGMACPVKIQDLFTNARVPAEERRRRLVAASASGDIFWVEGLRIGERFKVTPATRRCLVWRVRRSPGRRR